MPPKTVWVLGAGFSRPLGGPLLPELLSEASASRLEASFSREWAPALFGGNTEPPGKARKVYSDNGPRGTNLWADAEQYLDALNAAVVGGADSSTWKLIAKLVDPLRVDAVEDAALRIMVAECCAFLKDANPNMEKWQPYRTWSKQLHPEDAVITFNYDRVLEELAEVGGNLEVMIPGQATKELSRAPVFKLHGSVDWRRDEKDGSISQFDKTYAVVAPRQNIVIASPGPSKKKETESLQGLWDGAMAQLRQADSIVFVGYRFPETDAISRQQLLGAIGANRQRVLCLHTVLGASTAKPAPQRLKGMLGHALRLQNRVVLQRPFGGDISGVQPCYTLDLHPLYAQDFLDLHLPSHLVQAYRFVPA
jgi:hypothetical protein